MKSYVIGRLGSIYRSLKIWFTYSFFFETSVDNIKNCYYKKGQSLQNETENSYQKFIAKCDRGLLQSVSGFTKSDRLLLQSASGITKCDRLLLQSASGITKCDRLLLQSTLGITKCDRLLLQKCDRLLLQSET